MNITAAANTSNDWFIKNCSLQGRRHGIAHRFYFRACLYHCGETCSPLFRLFAVNRRRRKRSLFSGNQYGICSPDVSNCGWTYIHLLCRGCLSILDDWIRMDILVYFSMVADSFFTFASLISAAFMSAERLNAAYWPLKHRTLLTRAYRFVILMIWTLAVVFTAIVTALNLFISAKHSTYLSTIYTPWF